MASVQQDWAKLAYMAIAAGAMAAGLAIGHDMGKREVGGLPARMLIAHGCDKAGGDLWAVDESDFPTQCKAIERWR